MRLPSKIVTYDESILRKFPIVLEKVRYEDVSPGNLYAKVKRHFEDIGEFLEVMDCLFALGKINLDERRGVIYYVV